MRTRCGYVSWLLMFLGSRYGVNRGGGILIKREKKIIVNEILSIRLVAGIGRPFVNGGSGRWW